MSSKQSANSQSKKSIKQKSSESDKQVTDANWQVSPNAILKATRLNRSILTSGNVLQLQRNVGNRAMSKLLPTTNEAAGSSVIQRKRARPEGGKALDTYNINEPKYEVAKTKGAGYLESLKKRKDKFLESDEKPMEIWSKNYDDAAPLGYEFKTEMDSDERDDDGEVMYDITTQHLRDESNFYHNNILMPTGQIIADNNQAGENKFPPSNSEVIWQQYSMALDDYKKNYAAKHGDAQLSGISRQSITNKDTLAVIWMVYNSDTEGEKTVAPSSDDGKALLGTPNGKSSVWMLNDHLEELGNKTIQSIDLEKEEGQNMNINIS